MTGVPHKRALRVRGVSQEVHREEVQILRLAALAQDDNGLAALAQDDMRCLTRQG
ncbi:MAG: hypothetical protein ABI625_02465 [bacterium]